MSYEIKKKIGTRVELAKLVLNATDPYENFLLKVMYTDKANFHMKGHVNRHTFFIWEQKQPQVIYQQV